MGEEVREGGGGEEGPEWCGAGEGCGRGEKGQRVRLMREEGGVGC